MESAQNDSYWFQHEMETHSRYEIALHHMANIVDSDWVGFYFGFDVRGCEIVEIVHKFVHDLNHGI